MDPCTENAITSAMATPMCVSCSNEVLEHHEAIECELCENWQHRACDTRISRQFYFNKRKMRRLVFHCIKCQHNPEDTATGQSSRSLDIEDNFCPPAASTLINSDLLPESLRTTDEADGDTNIPPEPETEQEHPSSPQFNINTTYTRPDSLVEDEVTMNYAQVDHVPPQQSSVITYKILKAASKRGGDILVDNLGYTYSKKTTTKTRTHWTCSIRRKDHRCPGSVTQRGDEFTRGTKSHDHEGSPGLDTKFQTISKVKNLARQDVLRPAPSIVEEVMTSRPSSAPTGTRLTVNNLIRIGNRAREGLRPQDPKDFSFKLAKDHIPGDFLVKDLKDDEDQDFRHLIFATPQQLQLLCRCKTLYLDGTFKIVGEPFTQLWSIHGFLREGDHVKQVPLVCVLMSRRQKKDYKKVLKKILKKLPTQPAVKQFVLDFEAGCWAAIREVFPTAGVRGCSFHWCQAVWRQIQNKGLREAYIDRTAIYYFLKMVMALPFLPHTQIDEAFHKLRSMSPALREVQEVLDYVSRTWIESSIWPPSAWSVFGYSVRTNNDVEGWHRRLNAKSPRPHLPLYTLIPLLHKESMLVNLQMTLVFEKKLRRYQSKKTLRLEARVQDLWDQYSKKQVTTYELLKAVSHINGPTNL